MKAKKLWAIFFIAVAAFVIFAVITAKKNEESIYSTTSAAAALPTVIVDAGHGTPDGGTSADDGTLEKDINLNIAGKLNTMLGLIGVKTIMTRTDDNAIFDGDAQTIRQKKISDIHNRAAIIENAGDAVFVSIHQNHYFNSKYSGTQVFYSGNNSDSEALANDIQSSVRERLQPDNERETKRSGTEIYLLYHAQIPAVMVECGFLSNPEETLMLKDDGYCSKLTFSIMCGICEYFKNTEAL